MTVYRWAVWPHILMLGTLALPFRNHPLHTTLTEIHQSGSEVTIRVRGFVDDLTLAATGKGQGSVTAASADSSISRYLSSKLVLRDKGSRPVSLVWRGARRQAGVAWFTFTGRLVGGLPGTHIGNSALAELYEDQVNIVQVRIGAAHRTFLFTPGDELQQIR